MPSCRGRAGAAEELQRRRRGGAERIAEAGRMGQRGRGHLARPHPRLRSRSAGARQRRRARCPLGDLVERDGPAVAAAASPVAILVARSEQQPQCLVNRQVCRQARAAAGLQARALAWQRLDQACGGVRPRMRVHTQLECQRRRGGGRRRSGRLCVLPTRRRGAPRARRLAAAATTTACGLAAAAAATACGLAAAAAATACGLAAAARRHHRAEQHAAYVRARSHLVRLASVLVLVLV